ncbi:MAG TPA: 4'-phosphopantetheinyl transferase superfamily protein [Methanocorpusculum sp.]|nr:4'-phosphopantetheinyl transferase superfamily protein [Methanocorpusculum sp.]
MRIYSASVDELLCGHDVSFFYPVVSEYRQKQIDKFVFEKDRRLGICVELLLLRAMKEEGIADEKYEITVGKFGKPELVSHPEFCFNLSHSEPMVMCVAASVPIGCDIEKITPFSPDLAKFCFTGNEYEKLMKKPAGFERNLYFCRLWTLKESFMKATGLGMNLKPDSFEIEISADGQVSVHQNVSDAQFGFIEGNNTDGFCRSVCFEKK